MNPPSCHTANEHSDQNLPLFILIMKYYRWTDNAVKDTHHMVTSIHSLHNNFVTNEILTVQLVCRSQQMLNQKSVAVSLSHDQQTAVWTLFLLLHCSTKMHWQEVGYQLLFLLWQLCSVQRDSTVIITTIYWVSILWTLSWHSDPSKYPHFNWVQIYRNSILVPVHSLVWLTVTVFSTECYSAA
jgi:hypothetical protein